MGKSDKKLDEVKKNLKQIKKEDMKKIVGGKDEAKGWKRWISICGNILPQ